MKREKISETIGNIAPKYIEEAVQYTETAKKMPKRHPWVALAACFALVLAIGIPLMKDWSTSQNDKTIVDSVMLIEYENAYLEIIEDPIRSKRFGLDREITEDVVGNHIAYLQKSTPEAERSNYIAADGETDIELLVYSPAPYQGVRIFRDGDKYYYALFCNYLLKTSESLPIQEAFAVYGIHEASDILRILPVDCDNSWEATGSEVTDSAAIAAFFHEISKLSASCFDDYHRSVFADEDDVESDLYAQVADNRKDIVIETKDGLRFAIQYYPSYGWISVSATMSYYQMSPDISAWFSHYGK